MIDIKILRENPEIVKKALEKRGAKLDVDKLLNLDKEKRELIQVVENLRAEKNRLSSKGGQPEEIEKAKELKNKLKEKEERLKKITEEFESQFILIPNIPFDDVPVGGEDKKVIVKEWGEVRKFDFEIKDHTEIGQDLDLIDLERAAKLSGSRFGILKNEAVMLEFALVNLAFDLLIKKGFIPVIPPALIKKEAMQGMGYIDTKEDLAERYYLKKDRLFLVGTSEQAIGPMHKNETFLTKELPKRYVGFSSCFREEAGSYGKDTRGIFRVHQFDKVEMFSFTKKEESSKEHQFLLAMEEELMQALEIPYKVAHLPTGDMARPSASTYDIEAFIPSQGKYREVQSVSNCTDFQARRLNIRYKDGSQTEFVHMLNGTAFAIGRTIIAILENFQQKEGTIKMPKALHKYLGFKVVGK